MGTPLAIRAATKTKTKIVSSGQQYRLCPSRQTLLSSQLLTAGNPKGEHGGVHRQFCEGKTSRQMLHQGRLPLPACTCPGWCEFGCFHHARPLQADKYLFKLPAGQQCQYLGFAEQPAGRSLNCTSRRSERILKNNDDRETE